MIGDLHALWGLPAIRGRTLTVADERPGAPGVAVLSHRFWSTRFGGSMDIIGRDIRLDGEHRTLVGVLTPDIELGNISEIDVWLPYQGDATQASRTDRSWRGVGRLAGGATIDSAHAQVPRSPREWRRNTRTPIATAPPGLARRRTHWARPTRGLCCQCSSRSSAFCSSSHAPTS